MDNAPPPLAPNLIQAGHIRLADDDESPTETVPYCLVIQCAGPEQVREAMSSGTVQFTRFAHYGR